MSEIVRDASDTSTFVPDVTKAAIISAVVPEIATAFVTVIVPVVAPPIELNSVAFTAVPSASLTVTVASLTSTFVPAVINAAVT